MSAKRLAVTALIIAFGLVPLAPQISALAPAVIITVLLTALAIWELRALAPLGWGSRNWVESDAPAGIELTPDSLREQADLARLETRHALEAARAATLTFFLSGLRGLLPRPHRVIAALLGVAQCSHQFAAGALRLSGETFELPLPLCWLR